MIWIWLLMTCMVSSKPKKVTRPVFKLFRLEHLQCFYNAKNVFLVVNASLHWLNNVSGVYLVQVSLLLIGQRSSGHFFRYRPLLLIGWRIVQILRHHRRKTTNTAPTALSPIQAASQSTFINAQLYSTWD
jgi:hypothetical protein